ncbi:MAG: hypothetical protein ABJB40_02770 [Acidobacteriota bacterium]
MMENDRPFTIVFEDYPKYLYALVHGERYGYDVLAHFLKEIADECKKRGFDQVLIEENISATASEEDVFRIASTLPELGFADIRMAYIDRFAEQKDINEFGQEVAEKQGVDVKIFSNMEDADRWLSGSGA